MTWVGMGLSPLNPLALEPPDITPRQPTARAPSGLSGVTMTDTSNGGMLIRPPDPGAMSQGAENDLASRAQTFDIQPRPQNHQVLQERGMGTQIDLVA